MVSKKLVDDWVAYICAAHGSQHTTFELWRHERDVWDAIYSGMRNNEPSPGLRFLRSRQVVIPQRRVTPSVADQLADLL